MIVLAYDHRGYEMMKKCESYLCGLGYEVKVCASAEYDVKDSYAHFAREANRLVLENEGNIGVYCCRTGIGISIMANRCKGIRAGLCTNNKTTFLARKDDNINVLVMPCHLNMFNVKRMLKTFLNTSFEGGRHLQRVAEYDK